ncbi:hypothetical protein DOU01_15540 [Clavibacter michiganensis subsp. michiganensis]|nr:hypothetical protein [Clavibacter michiganensis subsp. michiganensis]
MGERVSGRNKGACDRVPKVLEEPAAQPLARKPADRTLPKASRHQNGPAGSVAGRAAAPMERSDQRGRAARAATRRTTGPSTARR